MDNNEPLLQQIYEYMQSNQFEQAKELCDELIGPAIGLAQEPAIGPARGPAIGPAQGPAPTGGQTSFLGQTNSMVSQTVSDTHKGPQNLETLEACGLVYAKLKDFSKAKLCFEMALQQNPNAVAFHINLSNIYVALNDVEKAKQHLHQALRLDPHHAESYNNLGRLLYKQNLFLEAIPLFEKALRLNPEYWEAHYNLAHSFTMQNQTLRAAQHYREVIRIKPDHPFAHYNLGLLYFEEKDYEAAETQLLRALELGINIPMPSAIYYLAHTRLAMGKIKEATHSFEKVIQSNSGLPSDLPSTLPQEILAESHHNLGVLYLRAEQKIAALEQFEKALSLQPNNDTARHMIMALKSLQSTSEVSSKIPSQAPPHYIAELFDQYSDYYDEHVKHDLKYKVPGLLRNAVGHCLGHSLRPGRVLDIGCGTGLCGVYFRDLALTLIGIDLSPKMVEKAKSLGAYEEVICGDFNEYLTKKQSSEKQTIGNFDLIIAGDVLVYMGDLKQTFENIAQVLNLNGRFAFTIEEISNIEKMSDESNVDNMSANDYFLQSTGRFAHSISYIHKLSQNNHLLIELEESIVPRENQGKAVMGRLFVLKKEI